MTMARSALLAAGERFPDSRAALRYPMIALAEITEPLKKRTVNGWTSVISLTGCYVRAADPPTAGTVVRLRIERDGATFETWAQIAHVRPNDGMGLAFFDTRQAQMDVLRGWIAELARAATKQ
jgi:hypothetical protein